MPLAVTAPPMSEVRARLLAEGLIDFDEAVSMFPRRRGRGRGHGTILRWILRGKAGVRLEGALVTVPDGRTWRTSRAAVVRFARALGITLREGR